MPKKKKELAKLYIRNISLNIAFGLAIREAKRRGLFSKAVDFVDRLKKQPAPVSSSSGIFSKTLGRMLTVDEAISRGLM